MKKEFRKNVINNRNQQSKEFIEINSSIITEKLLSLDCVKNSRTIMLYLDFNNEVQTTELVNKLIKLNKFVAIPVTLIDKKLLEPRQITDLKNEVAISSYGIREPKEEYCSKVKLENIDVVIVPAVAYDENCYRLGYGGGFYDRFLKNLRNDCIKIGVAFDLQIFNDIPKEDHDAQVNFVVTESRTIYSNK